jgi:hypothetical protein
MSVVLIAMLVLGPPKLPPLPGRAMPAPVEEHASEAPAAPPPVEAKRDPGVPAAPPPSAPSTASRAPARPPSSAPSSSIAGAIFPGAKPPPAPPPAAAGSAKPGTASSLVRGESSAPALRLVSGDEVAGWDSGDRKARAAAPKGAAAPTHETRDTTVRRTAMPNTSDDRLTFRRAPHPPRRSAAFVLGYRYFRIQDSLGRAQDWHLASLEVTPMRRYVRLNLITEFGIEGGPAARAGDRADILLMERLGLGAQLPGVVTPFIEFQGGIGGARVELFGRNDLAMLYALGLDVGAQWAVTRWMYVHAAIGWIRPTFVWPNRTSSFDRVAFKLGIGF